MKKEEQSLILDFLNKADCLYTGKVLSECEKIQLIDNEDIKSLSVEPTVTEKQTGITLSDIASKISICNRCQLAKTRRNTVPGEGVPNPLVLVIGEAPGEDEDKQGRPFVGKAGKLLDKMLASIQLSRNCNCFIANIIKCRPPENRDPLPEEISACSNYLEMQIHVLKPAAILAVGRIALQSLLNTSIGISKIHGQLLQYNNIPFMATYHPSALLRNEALKRPAWEDLKLFRNKLLEISPDYQIKFSTSINH